MRKKKRGRPVLQYLSCFEGHCPVRLDNFRREEELKNFITQLSGFMTLQGPTPRPPDPLFEGTRSVSSSFRPRRINGHDETLPSNTKPHGNDGAWLSIGKPQVLWGRETEENRGYRMSYFFRRVYRRERDRSAILQASETSPFAARIRSCR